MDHRRDALTNFDRTYLRQLERSSPSSTNVRLTKEARQALQLRELYKNPVTQPEGIVILEGQEIIEYDGRPEQQEGTAPETVLDSVIEAEGTDSYFDTTVVKQQPVNSESKPQQSVESSDEEAIEAGGASEPKAGADREADESTSSIDNHSRSDKAGTQRTENFTVSPASNQNAKPIKEKSTSSTDDDQCELFRPLIGEPYEEEAFDAFMEDEYDNESSVKIEEEYKDLVKLKQLRMEGKPKEDHELRAEIKKNENDLVKFMAGDETDVSVEDFIHQYGQESPGLDAPPQPDAQADGSSRPKSKKSITKPTKSDLQNLQSDIGRRRSNAIANKTLSGVKLTRAPTLRRVYSTHPTSR